MARAVNAARDPAWTADGHVSDRWLPVSPVTGRLDAFQWRVPLAELGERPAIESHAATPRQIASPPLGSTGTDNGTALAPALEAPPPAAERPAAEPPAASPAPDPAAASPAPARPRPAPIVPLAQIPDDPGPEGAEDAALDRDPRTEGSTQGDSWKRIRQLFR